MIGIKVCRNPSFIGVCDEADPALNWGPDISDPLLSTVDAATERGRIEIDSSYTNRKKVTFTIPFRDYLPMGTIIGVEENGQVLNGMLTSLQISLQRSSVDSFSTATRFEMEGNVK
jgi:hypothetical protein